MHQYTDISLNEFPNEISLIIYNHKCLNQCPWCFNPGFINNGVLTWKQIKDAIDEYKDFITAVVFSGGEPLLIPHLQKAINYCKSKGLKVKLNTCGYVDESTRKNIFLPYVDYINISLKGFNTQCHCVSKSNIVYSIIPLCETLEYSFVYAKALWPDVYLKKFYNFLKNKISFDWYTLFSDRWTRPDIFTVSQMQIGNCLNKEYNKCTIPTKEECTNVALLFNDIPIKKLMIETKEYGREEIKKINNEYIE